MKILRIDVAISIILSPNKNAAINVVVMAAIMGFSLAHLIYFDRYVCFGLAKRSMMRNC